MTEFLKSLDISPKEDPLSRIVPFLYSPANSVVVTSSGDYVCTWFVKGLPFEGMSTEDAAAHMESLNLLVRGMSNGKFAFWVHRVRRSVSDSLTPPPDGFAHDFVQKYQQSLSNGGLMATEIYVTVVYRPNPQRAGRVLGRVGRNTESIEQETNAALDVMENTHSQVMSTLSAYGPRRLGQYTHNDQEFNAQLEFYAYLVNGHWWRIPAKNVPLNKYLPVSRVFFGNDIQESRDTYGSVFSSYVDIKDYADYSEPGMLNQLLALPCEYVETHSFATMNVLDARSALRRQKNQMISGEDSAASQVAQIDVAIDGLASGNFSLGDYHYSLQVKGTTIEEVKAFRSIAIEQLQAAGFLALHVDLVVEQAYGAQLPGNFRLRPRLAKLSSRNFTGLCALHNYSAGKRDNNPWGEALMLLRSPAAQPVYLNLHATAENVNSVGAPALGNTQIVGMSGGGKTVLALAILMHMHKYGTQMVYFDKDRGAEIGIRASGGKYLPLERGKPTGFAPFKLEPTQPNILFWEDLIRFCTTVPGRPHTAREDTEITHACNAVALMPKSARSFGALIQNLPNTEDESLSHRLRKWCATSVKGEREGSLGWALDCDSDMLEFEAGRTYGFDYTEVLDDKSTCAAIMMYLMYRVEEQIDGRRFAFFMDEYWKALSIPYFEDFAKNKQKTIRKQNGLGVYITQSPSDTLTSPIAKALIEQTATFIFLPNPTADAKDYMDGFKLTQAEFDTVKSLPTHGQMFVIKQGSKISVAQLNLAGFKDELKILSGSTDNVHRLEKLMARLGEDPSSWLEPFIKGELS